MDPLVLEFRRERETKGTWRYQEEERPDGEAVGSLYVKKAALGENPPDRLRVTIESAS
ncbi:MAG TPA: hypothetical protein VGO86_08805 [Candidatus Dormibacteraeota bacterium]